MFKARKGEGKGEDLMPCTTVFADGTSAEMPKKVETIGVNSLDGDSFWKATFASCHDGIVAILTDYGDVRKVDGESLSQNYYYLIKNYGTKYFEPGVDPDNYYQTDFGLLVHRPTPLRQHDSATKVYGEVDESGYSLNHLTHIQFGRIHVEIDDRGCARGLVLKIQNSHGVKRFVTIEGKGLVPEKDATVQKVVD